MRHMAHFCKLRTKQSVIHPSPSPARSRSSVCSPPQPASAVGAALARTLVAAVGPIVAEALARHGIRAQVMPQEAFFMKPLTTALEEQLGRGPR
jgi:uroporphyrinogen-III synthase